MEAFLISISVVYQVYLGFISDKKWERLTTVFRHWLTHYLISILVGSFGIALAIQGENVLGGLMLLLPFLHLSLMQIFNLIIQ